MRSTIVSTFTAGSASVLSSLSHGEVNETLPFESVFVDHLPLEAVETLVMRAIVRTGRFVTYGCLLHCPDRYGSRDRVLIRRVVS